MKYVTFAEPSTLALFGGGLLLLFLLLLAVLTGIVVFLIAHYLRQKKPPAAGPPPAPPRTQIVPRQCPRCGAELRPDVPEGLCPACLLQRGIATEGGAPPGQSPFVPPPVAELAKLFPQLEIFECLGRGGMGAVYKARQPRLDRLVALKILAPEKQSDPQFAERFEREARALARLNHPDIVAVYDFGEVEGRFYLLMEFVDGLSLRQLLQSGKMRPQQALSIVPKICEALQYAHEQGIVHRDIKPENILLDKQGRVKIADFGIAKMVGLGAKDMSLTGAKDVVGTPHYMAPEQIEKPTTVDHRADIFSLGVVFYEMLTGELPLGKFQPPSCKVQIDVRIDEVVLHTLEKEPERRYQQASEVKTAVETIAKTENPKAENPKSDHFWRFIVIVFLVIPVLGLLTTIAIQKFIKPRYAPEPGLVGWWSADNTASDPVGGGNGVLANGVTFAPGVRGQAFRFNGNGACVKIPQTPALNPGNQVTVEFWMKADPNNEMQNYQGLVTSDFYGVEISNGYGGRLGVNFGLSTTDNSPVPENGITSVGNYTEIANVNGGGAPVTAGEWHLVAGTYDGQRLQLYIDGLPWGQPVFHTGAIRPMLPNSFISIGSEDGRTTCPDCMGRRYFKGLIDEVKIYNRALSAAEINAVYRQPQAAAKSD